eukprot:1265313-Pyramimonas_sp.AAC.1
MPAQPRRGWAPAKRRCRAAAWAQTTGPITSLLAASCSAPTTNCCNYMSASDVGAGALLCALSMP